MYDYNNPPPLLIHYQYLAQAREVDLTRTNAKMKRLSTPRGSRHSEPAPWGVGGSLDPPDSEI